VVSRVLHGPGIDEPMMIRSGANEAYLYADGLGSIIAVADANATLQETVEYGAYGQTVYKDAVSGSTSTVSNTGNPYGYTGREPDAETGLYYYRARYYDVEAGRFIQSDPIGFAGGDTNLYGYVRNNPSNATDATGMVRDEILGNSHNCMTGDLFDVFLKRTTSRSEIYLNSSRGKLLEVLRYEKRYGTYLTFGKYAFGNALGTHIRLKNGYVADLQYTIDIGLAQIIPVIGPAFGTSAYFAVTKYKKFGLGNTNMLSDPENMNGFVEGFNFSPLTVLGVGPSIKSLIDPNYLKEIGYEEN